MTIGVALGRRRKERWAESIQLLKTEYESLPAHNTVFLVCLECGPGKPTAVNKLCRQGATLLHYTSLPIEYSVSLKVARQVPIDLITDRNEIMPHLRELSTPEVINDVEYATLPGDIKRQDNIVHTYAIREYTE